MMAEGGNKEPLISLKEFRDHFANASQYRSGAENQAESKILLYKYRSDATHKDTVNPENTWKRVEYVPKIEYPTDEGHAERIMIEELYTIQRKIEKCTIHSIEVIQSYSPCGKCSEKLCKLKEDLDGRKPKDNNVVPTDNERGETIDFTIIFSNFDQHDGEINSEGLKNLLKRGIKLGTLTDDNWKYFFNATGLVTDRQRREMDDKKILQYFEETVALEKTTRYLVDHTLGLPPC